MGIWNRMPYRLLSTSLIVLVAIFVVALVPHTIVQADVRTSEVEVPADGDGGDDGFGIECEQGPPGCGCYQYSYSCQEVSWYEIGDCVDGSTEYFSATGSYDQFQYGHRRVWYHTHTLCSWSVPQDQFSTSCPGTAYTCG